jgi:hypothetical protein
MAAHTTHTGVCHRPGAAVRACAAGPRSGRTAWSCMRQHARAARAPSPVPLRPRRAHTPGALGRHRIPGAAQLAHNALAPGSALPPTLRATSPRVATPVSRDRSGALPASPPLPPLRPTPRHYRQRMGLVQRIRPSLWHRVECVPAQLFHIHSHVIVPKNPHFKV